MDITPHVNLLRSLRGDRIDYVLLVGEAVDNSFDAGATQIDIIVDRDKISFQDNGVGVTKDRLGAVFSLGEHRPMATTGLGRFGIGIKSLAVNAGDLLQIASVSRDGHVKVQVNWREILESGQWKLKDNPRWLPIAVGKPTGTNIRISDLRPVKSPSGGWDAKIIADVSERFHPALAEGWKITVNGKNATSLPEPEMTDIVDVPLSFAGGRSAHLRAGILLKESKLNRMHVGFRHRVIMPGSTFGIAEYSGLNKMFGRLMISGPWLLSKYKTDLPDEAQRDELEKAVCDALADMLEKCSSQHEDLRLNELATLINDGLPEDLKASARPHRKRDIPTIEAHRRRRQNGEVSPDKSDPNNGGPARSLSRKGHARLKITFDGSTETHGIGEFVPGRPHQVNLSRDHPVVAQWITHRDQGIAAQALRTMAYLLYEAGRPIQEEQPELQFESIGLRVARLLALQNEEDRKAESKSIVA